MLENVPGFELYHWPETNFHTAERTGALYKQQKL
jgi:hypothetical protein